MEPDDRLPLTCPALWDAVVASGDSWLVSRAAGDGGYEIKLPLPSEIASSPCVWGGRGSRDAVPQRQMLSHLLEAKPQTASHHVWGQSPSPLLPQPPGPAGHCARAGVIPGASPGSITSARGPCPALPAQRTQRTLQLPGMGLPQARVTQAMISGMLMPGQGPASSLPGSLRAPSSHNLVMKHLPGADPELVLLSFRYEELEVRAGWVWGRRGAPGYFCPSLSQQGALRGAGWELWL